MRLQASFFKLAILSAVWPYLCADASVLHETRQATPGGAVANSTQTAANTYDYVIVGSGPGGGPLAARLAQAGYSVILLEAGEDHGLDPIVQIPLFQTFSSEYEPITWQYFVEHFSDPVKARQDTKYTYRKPDGTFWVGPNPPSGSTPLGIYYPRAAALGGCAEHNALVALYPADDDWRVVQSLTGDSSWAPSNMRQYWMRMENNHYLTPGTPEAEGHGFSGWLHTTLTDLTLVFSDQRWLSVLRGAATIFGLPNADAPIDSVTRLASMMITDPNADIPTRDTTNGIYQLPLAVDNVTRTRSSPRELILDTANNSAFKLKVQLNSLVTKVLFNHTTSTPRAIGVQYQTGRHLYRADPNTGSAPQPGYAAAYARREVILAAGAFNTPQLLKLSGVGPRAELQALNIPVVLDAPGVGKNLQDRYEVTVTGTLPTTFPSYDGCTFLQTEDDPCYHKFLNNATHRGIYGTNGVAFGLLLASSVSVPTSSDLFVGGLPANFHGYFPGYSAAADLQTWSYLVLKAHTRNNAGTVTLRSADPRDPPKINFNNWAVGGDADLQAVYEGVVSARAMFNVTITPDGPYVETNPGPAIQTEAQIKEWIKTNAWGHHASCSVPIGAASDPNAVLDSSFRVRGINGLRVVDASVFPKIPDFYIVGAVYMISEKAADVIIQQATP